MINTRKAAFRVRRYRRCKHDLMVRVSCEVDGERTTDASHAVCFANAAKLSVAGKLCHGVGIVVAMISVFGALAVGPLMCVEMSCVVACGKIAKCGCRCFDMPTAQPHN